MECWSISRVRYWPADEPPPEVLVAPPAKCKAVELCRAKRTVGQQRVLTEAQIKTLEGWLAEGQKTRQEMARDLGGISPAKINIYRLAWIRKARDEAVAELPGLVKTPGLDLPKVLQPREHVHRKTGPKPAKGKKRDQK